MATTDEERLIRFRRSLARVCVMYRAALSQHHEDSDLVLLAALIIRTESLATGMSLDEAWRGVKLGLDVIEASQ